MQLRHLFHILAVLLASVVVFSLTSSTLAYTTREPSTTGQGKWQNIRDRTYSLNDNIDNLLTYRDPTTGTRHSVPGAANTVAYNAIAQWNNASRFSFTRTYPFNTGDAMYITAVDYWTVSNLGNCGVPTGGTGRNTAGANCVPSTYNSAENTDYLSKSEIFLNSTQNLSWTTNGTVSSAPATPSPSNPWSRSVLNTSMHEVGHSYKLEHDTNHQEAVMYPHTTYAVHTLQEDDKNGATQIYGVRTTWEDGFATGEIDTIAFWNGLVGSYGIPEGNPMGFPILARSTAEQPASYLPMVYPHAGSTWMERFAGCSERNGSYAYMRLFTSANDGSTESSIQRRPYLRIRSGMKLVYAQYNLQQRTFGVDFKMIDSAGNTSYLRDSGLMDTANHSVHPAGRRNYPAREWFMTYVDLTPLAGKKILEYYFAYDDGGITFDPTRTCTPFRAYIDNLRIEYP